MCKCSCFTRGGVEDKVILSANSVLKGKTEVGGVYMGIPAELVKYRDLENGMKLKNISYFL